MKRSGLAIGMLATFLLAIGVMTWNPAASFAAEGDGDLIAGMDVAENLQPQATKYEIWIGGEQVTSKNAKDVLGDGTVSYDATTKTLTLNDAKIKGSYTWSSGSYDYAAGICCDTSDTLTLKLEGTSTVTSPFSKASQSYGVVVYGGLVVEGGGKLTVQAAKAKYYSDGIWSRSLTVKGKAKLVAKGATATLKNYEQFGGYGISVTENLCIADKARVTASGGNAAFYSYEGFVMPTFSDNYVPYVEAGDSAKSLKLKAKNPSSSVYAKYKYVSIRNAS